jgi:hypothetical protein
MKRKVSRRRVDALIDLLDRIDNELPATSFIVSEDGEEETIEIEEAGIEVSTLEVVIDEALAEFQKDGVLPKKKKGAYSLSGAFEVVFGSESDIASLALDLETALSGYEDMVYADDIELAQSLIRDIKRELNNAINAQ